LPGIIKSTRIMLLLPNLIHQSPSFVRIAGFLTDGPEGN